MAVRRSRVLQACVALLGAGVATAGVLVLLPDGPAAPPAVRPSPAAGAQPGAGNTGVPDGVTLTASGPVTVSKDGAVLDGLDIAGCLRINASDVTVRNTRVRCRSKGNAVTLSPSARRVLLSDVEVDGLDTTHTCVLGKSMTLRRVDVHSCIDGAHIGSDTLVEDSWFHDLARVPGSHNDTLQTEAGTGITVRHNTLQPFTDHTNDPMNAAYMIHSINDWPIGDVLVTDNWIDGGNYTINVGNHGPLSNIVVEGNRFGRNFRYGLFTNHGNPAATFRDNVWADTGEPAVTP